MSKGPDQGDYETPTAGTTSPAEPWPTEPSSTEPVSPEPTTTPPAGPDEPDAPATTATVVHTETPGDVGQLPTTSGTDPAVALTAVAAAAALLACGCLLAFRHRKRTH